jgi:hypothetical protein
VQSARYFPNAAGGSARIGLLPVHNTCVRQQGSRCLCRRRRRGIIGKQVRLCRVRDPERQSLCCPRNGKRAWARHISHWAESPGRRRVKTCEPVDRPRTPGEEMPRGGGIQMPVGVRIQFSLAFSRTINPHAVGVRQFEEMSCCASTLCTERSRQAFVPSV